jgi:hypothetical protein
MKKAVPVVEEYPVFFNVTDNVDAVFAVSLPNDKLAGVADKVGPESVSGYKFNGKSVEIRVHHSYRRL